MSVIDLGITPNLCWAVNCKTSNETVSEKTLRKLDTIALGLYRVGNSSDWRDACRQLGMITSGVRPKDLYMGFKDVVNARAIVAGMRESNAKSQLAKKLDDIGWMIRARTEECVDSVIHREKVCTHALDKHSKVHLLYPNAGGRSDSQAEADTRKLQRAIDELGPVWAQVAEQQRAAMLVGRSTDPEDPTQPCSRQSWEFSGFFEEPSEPYRQSRRR